MSSAQEKLCVTIHHDLLKSIIDEKDVTRRRRHTKPLDRYHQSLFTPARCTLTPWSASHLHFSAVPVSSSHTASSL